MEAAAAASCPELVGVEMDVRELEREIRTETGREFLHTDRESSEMECCIFKIPVELSKHNEKAYSPYAFSIGPFHYSNPRTKATQTIKLRYFADFLRRGSSCPLRDLIKAVHGVHDRVLRHYDRPVDYLISPRELTKVMVLDGCFIIELFLKAWFEKDHYARRYDPIFSVPRMRQYLNHDLILLENQLPWMLLEMLYDYNISCYESHLATLALNFFNPVFSSAQAVDIRDLDFTKRGRNKHILDLLRNLLLSSRPNKYGPMNNPDKIDINRLEPIMLSATALEESGIKLQSNASGFVLDVTFREGVLHIPELLVHDTTEALFRNLVALELFCPNYDGVVSSYVKLFDDLVQTTADMKLLCKNKVIDNRLRLEKATQIFNQNSEEYSGIKENHYFELIAALDQYRRRRKGYYILRWRVYVRELKRVYFSHPWAAISTVAASFILIFTFLQTLFTIMSYKQC